jgi:hypothetical protein
MDDAQYDTLGTDNVVIDNARLTNGVLIYAEKKIIQLENENKKLIELLQQYVDTIVIENLIKRKRDT